MDETVRVDRMHTPLADHVAYGAYRDGKRGLIRAQMAAVYQFMIVAKVIECKIRAAK